jgi:nitronate monooxygenase
MPNRSIAESLDISIPVIQAPMAGGGDTAELVAAVSNAGALGCIGAAYLTPQQIVDRGKAVKSMTVRPFGINLFAPLPESHADAGETTRAITALTPYYQELGIPVPSAPTAARLPFDDQLAACLETGASMFSFAFGVLPQKALQEIKKRGFFLAGTATTVNEAKALVEAGVDAVVAQGSEAGGHRSTFDAPFDAGMIGLVSLVPQIADAVPVPVIASGGIMDGRGIAAAFALGASAVQMGTAFLTCDESGVANSYKDAILRSSEDQTRITRAFSGRPARGIRNRLLADFEQRQDSILPFPLQNSLTRPLRTEATKQNRADFLSLWAGQGTRLARRERAAELIAQLQRELKKAIDHLNANR